MSAQRRQQRDQRQAQPAARASNRPRRLKEAGEEACRVLRELIVEAVEKGRLRPERPDPLAPAAWSTVHGPGLLIIEEQVAGARGDPGQRRALTDTVVRRLQRGLRRKAS